MKRRFKFEKELDGWFVDLPEWEGSKADLAMVMGADTFLDLICEGEWYVWITLSTEPFNGCNVLDLTHYGTDEVSQVDIEQGAWYKLNSYRGIEFDLDMWLCEVTRFVFGHLPKKIYFAC
jgi:hypothetical protein